MQSAVALENDIEVSSKLEWILENFQCPVCRTAHPVSPDDLKCNSCGISYLQDTGALNFISPDMLEEFNLTPTDNVSAHVYDPIARGMIDQGGMVLDCGLSLIHI